MTDLFLFGPGTSLFVTAIARRLGLQTVAGVRSDVLGLMLFIPILMARMALDDEEDDTTRWATQTLLKHTMLGYLPSKGIDWFWNVADAVIKKDDRSVKELAQSSIDPFVPLRGIVGPVVEALLGGRYNPF